MHRWLILLLTAFLFTSAEAQLHISLPSATGMHGDTIGVPLAIDDVTGFEVLAYQCTVSFDTSIVKIVDVVTAGTLSSQTGWSVLSNIVAGSIRIGAFGPNPLTGGGALLKLKLYVAGSAGSVSPITFSQSVLNAGVPASVWQHGSLKVDEKPRISVDAGRLDFGECAVNDSTVLTMTLRNPSGASVVISALSTTSKTFNVPQSLPQIILPHDSLRLNIIFKPTVSGIVVDTATIISNAGSMKITLTGIGKTTTGITPSPGGIPNTFSLAQNHPNPFNPSTSIAFSIPFTSNVALSVYNSLGIRVQMLISAVLPAGTYVQRWDASAFPSGLYYYRLQTGSYSATKRALYLK